MQHCRTGLATILILGLALAGCVTAPTYPLLTPIQVAQTFGYSETPLAPDRYEVSYVTPRRDALGYRFDPSPTVQAAKTLAMDLALLRAAQIAQTNNFQGFDVADRHSSSDDENIGPSWGGPWGPGGGWGGEIGRAHV